GKQASQGMIAPAEPIGLDGKLEGSTVRDGGVQQARLRLALLEVSLVGGIPGAEREDLLERTLRPAPGLLTLGESSFGLRKRLDEVFEVLERGHLLGDVRWEEQRFGEPKHVVPECDELVLARRGGREDNEVRRQAGRLHPRRFLEQEVARARER